MLIPPQRITNDVPGPPFHAEYERLVRVICEDCKTLYQPDAKELEKLGNFALHDEKPQYFKGTGCETCGMTGYQGRTGILELLPITPEMRTVILKSPEANVIKAKAVASGIRTLREDGFLKIVRGVTTLDEVIRVTQEE